MLLEVKDLGISYGKRDPVVRHVTFNLEQGKILAIVGESGSGKTTVIRAIQHVLPGGGHISEGQALLEGQDTELKTPEMHRKLSGTDVSMIFQDSGAMMNPIRLIGDQFREFLAIHGMTDEKEAHDRMIEMLTMVRLPDPEQILKSYTFELSGGMRQRVGIAMGMTYQPKLLLADEPTSALDVTTQAQIVRQMMELRENFGTSLIVVTHNLGVACYMSDHIIVMKNGRIEDQGSRDYMLHESENAYTKKLLDAVPSIGGQRYV